MNPDDRRATLAQEPVHVDRGDQGIVDHDDRRARRLERARDKARVGLVEPVPVAAVNEHVHGRRAIAGGEDVEALAGVRAVGEIEPAVERGARLGAGDRVPRQPVGALLDLLAVVVLGVEGVLVVVAIDALRHLAATMPKAPGACQRSRLTKPLRGTYRDPQERSRASGARQIHARMAPMLRRFTLVSALVLAVSTFGGTPAWAHPALEVAAELPAAATPASTMAWSSAPTLPTTPWPAMLAATAALIIAWRRPRRA